MPAANRETEPKPFATWDEVVAFALALPATELATSYGKPAVKLRGKAFVYPGREPGSFCLAPPIREKWTGAARPASRSHARGAWRPVHLLMETEPETFWETPHYRGWPAVLVRYGSPSRERIGGPVRAAPQPAVVPGGHDDRPTVIERGWWDRASKAQKAARGSARP
ncbi:MAG: hypothetical protein ACXWU1_10460 [Allosphingosinicella sp.]